MNPEISAGCPTHRALCDEWDPTAVPFWRFGRQFPVLRCIPSKDKVGRFGLLVAGEAAFHKRRITSFAVCEVTESPSAGRRVLFGVLDHKLNVRRGPGNERLGLPEDFVVFVRRDITVVQSSNDGAVRVRKLVIPESGVRYVVAQNGAQTVELPGFMSRGDPPPVAVPLRNLGNVRSASPIRLRGNRDNEGDKAGDCRNCNQEECEVLHKGSSI